MKRTAWVLLVSVALSLTTAVTAFAVEYPPTESPPGGAAPGPGGGVAQTGANIALGAVILVALIFAGVALTAIARRRRTEA
ncbi:MAG: hypothetical protein ABR518_00290 [Actinomycetota bacterium]